MRSSCRAEHFTIGGRNDTTDNVFGADVFVAKIKTEKCLIICSKNIGFPNGPFCVPAKVNQVTFNYIYNTKHFDEFFFVFVVRGLKSCENRGEIQNEIQLPRGTFNDWRQK